MLSAKKQAEDGTNGSLLYQNIDWLGIHVEVPANWEIAGHGRNPDRGKLVFVDRRRQRLELTWLACRTRPDGALIMKERHLKDRAMHGAESCGAVQRKNGWFVYEWSSSGIALERRGRYFDKRSMWVEAVFSGSGADDDCDSQVVAESIAFDDHGEGRMRWRAFGIDCTTPAEVKLTRVEVRPADCTLAFSWDLGEAVLHRLKVPELWYEGAAEDEAAHLVDEKARRALRPVVYQTHSAFSASWMQGGAWERLIRKQRFCRDIVWECKSGKTVYHLSYKLHRAEKMEQEYIRVVCCALAGGFR